MLKGDLITQHTLGLSLTTTKGYYLVNVMCVLVGAITFIMFIRPQALKLQSLPMRAWRISEN
jgi:PAT family acetyl-CoA transporter-like MFS transporter 1